MMYEYQAWLSKIVDGDTLHVGIDLGLDVATQQTIRLYGLNTPEMSTEEGRAAKAWVEQWFAEHAPDGQFTLQTVKDRREKYGRYLGIVVGVDNANLNLQLVESGQAVPYPRAGSDAPVSG